MKTLKIMSVALLALLLTITLMACGTDKPSKDDEPNDEPNDEPGHEEDEGEPGELEYELNEDGQTYAVVGLGTYKRSALVISSEYKGKPVTCIAKGAFEDCTEIISVTIPNGITSIGGEAFLDCTALTNITIPDSVTSINQSAFEGCTGLTSITIPDSVTSIKSGAFYDCTALKSIVVNNNNPTFYSEGNCLIKKNSNELILGCKTSVIPNSVTSIGEGAFRGCTGLTSITIPDSVTSIGMGAFRGCTGLTSITIPDGVTSIEVGAFSGCTGLTNITFQGTMAEWGEIVLRFNWNEKATAVHCTDGDVPLK